MNFRDVIPDWESLVLYIAALAAIFLLFTILLRSVLTAPAALCTPPALLASGQFCPQTQTPRLGDAPSRKINQGRALVRRDQSAGGAQMPLGLAQAAEATGLNRSTISRAIKSGKVSGARDANGTWTVEPAELFRVFPPAESTPKAVPNHAQMELRAKLELAEARLADLKAVLEDMQGQRDRWETVATRLSLTRAAPQPAQRRWWRWR